jgi:hypothetical protein
MGIDRRGGCVACIVVLLLNLGRALAGPTSLPSTPPVSQGVGVNIHFTDPRPGELEMLAAAGFKWVRMDLGWGGIERKRGEYDFSAYDRLTTALERHGLKALFILDYGNPLYDRGESPHTDEGRAAFARWAAATAHHFKGRGYLWEMWNEPNIQFWKPKPDVDDYAKLALGVGKALREAAPDEAYIGPATSGIDLKFIETCFKAGCLEYWAAVSVHPYRQSAPETAARDYRELRTLIARYAPKAKQIPVISGEWGYSAAWNNFDEDKQGKYIARQLLTNAWQELPLSIWYDWHDDGTDPKEGEHHFGTVHFPYRKGQEHVYEPKPAYVAMRTLAEQLAGYTFNKRLLLEREDDFMLLFAKGQDLRLVAWTAGRDAREVMLPASPGAFSAVSHLGAALEPLSADAAGLRVKLTNAPVYLTPEKPNDLLITAANWTRLPLELMGNGPTSLCLGNDVRVRDAGGVHGAGINRFFTIGRLPTPTPLSVDCPLAGAERLKQATTLVSLNPLSVSLLPGSAGTLSVRVLDPSAAGLKATVSLVGIEGLEIDQTSQPLVLKSGESESTLRFPAKRADGNDYSVGIQLTDERGQVLVELPQANFSSVPDFAADASDGKTDAYRLEADGDGKVRSEQSLAVTTPLEAAPEPGMGVLRISYKSPAGWKFWQLVPAKPQLTAIRGEPRSLGLWIYGDGSGSIPRIRFTDSTGQTFQPSAEAITWKGWRYVTFPMQGPAAERSHWGGANDSVVHYPIHWTALFLLDRDAKRASEGTVYIAGPTLVR